MARQRTNASELARLLNSTKQPVYVLDDEQTIIFCNYATSEWLGRPADELLGCRCTYHSSPDVTGVDAVVAGLCPTPIVSAGKAVDATVSYTDSKRKLKQRLARFIPIGNDANEIIGTIAVISTQDMPESEEVVANLSGGNQNDTESIDLHLRLRKFRDQTATRYRIDRLLGDSPRMRRTREQIKLSADSRSSVTIVGPPGSGRQHVARAIHYANLKNADGALIPLACADLGAELLHSSITTLATKNPFGDEAKRSTLLLNNVEELPREIQAELVELVTTNRLILRVISTTQKPLDELAEQAKFRADLAAALSTITIELPPLAERREDIPLLAQMFVEEMNIRNDKQLGGLSHEALDCLHAYQWPGNVDELAQMMVYAHAQADDPEITVRDLPKRIQLAADATTFPKQKEQPIALDKLLERIELELINRALKISRGNKAKAARLLGMTRPRLYRRLVQLGIEQKRLYQQPNIPDN